MSPHLQSFYNDIHAWIKSGCPATDDFYRNTGLRLNYWHYVGRVYNIEPSDRHSYVREMTAQFEDAHLGPVLPFNTRTSYFTEMNNRTVFSNIARLAWIERHIS